MLRSYLFNCLSILVLLGLISCGGRDETKILVFSKTAGFEHESIPAGLEAIMELELNMILKWIPPKMQQLLRKIT